jgi:YidC/Oxa1 family membrane protein insertase
LTYALSNPVTGILQRILVQLFHLFERMHLPDEISPYVPALVVMAFLVKAITLPLTIMQQRSMQGMQALQPKFKLLQEQYKDDRETLAQKQMELYREHKVNPLGGCLPLIIQMVVFFGLFGAFGELAKVTASPSLVGEPFYWIPSLAVCEPNPFCPQAKVMAVPFLAIILFFTQLAFQRMMTPPTQSDDPQARAMATSMKILPFIFAYFSLTFYAGMSLYYIVFNLLSLVQQKWITPMKPAPAPAEGTMLAEAAGSSSATGPQGRARRSQQERRTHERERRNR